MQIKEIDGVIIATPDHWHSRITIDAAKAGKHVYVEKGLTRTFQETLDVYDAVKKTGIVFQLGHQNRQVEANDKAKQIIDQGLLGPINLVELTTNRNSTWVPGYGLSILMQIEKQLIGILFKNHLPIKFRLERKPLKDILDGDAGMIMEPACLATYFLTIMIN